MFQRGQGTAKLRPAPAADPDLDPGAFFLANRGVLERHRVDPTGKRPVKAGQVIMAAK